MAVGKITKSTVAALRKPTSGRFFLWDEKVSSFGVFVTSTGHVSYVLQYRMGGRETKTRRYTIGRHGSPWTPDTARGRAIQLLFDVQRGVDPLLAERSAKAATEADENLRLKAYYETFMKQHVEARELRSAKSLRQYLEKDLVPLLGEKLITEITRKDIVKRLDAVSERSKSAAVHVFTTLRALMNFAKKRGDLTVNVMEGMSKPHEIASRNRVLFGSELQRAWEAAYDFHSLDGVAIWMLLLTAQRYREVVDLVWEELDLSERIWTIPGARTKNKKDHIVPLTPTFIGVLDTHWPDSSQRKGRLFHTRLLGSSEFKNRWDAFLHRRVLLAGQASGTGVVEEIPPFTFHDLRRSVATGLQRLQVPIEHTEAILNHVSGTRSKLVDTYQLHNYREEKAVALGKWDQYLADLMARDDAWPGGKDLPKPS